MSYNITTFCLVFAEHKRTKMHAKFLKQICTNVIFNNYSCSYNYQNLKV